MRRLAMFATACLAALTPVLVASPATAAPPRSATAFFQLFQDRNDWTWSGGDNVTSLRAANGNTYWSFGDTAQGLEDPATGAYRAGWRLIPNSILVQRPDGTFAAATSGLAIPSPSGGDRYWAQGMFEAGGRLYVMAQRVRPLTGGGFQLRGVDLARFGFNSNGTLAFQGMVSTPSTGKIDGNSPGTAQYGADAVILSGYLYLFGYALAPGDTASPHRTYVASVPVGSVETPSAWQYYANGGWDPDMADATPILNAQVSSVRRIGGNWVLAYKPWHGYGSTVYIERRSNLFWTPEATTTIHSPAGTTPGGERYTTYAPQLHPEQSLTSGRLLVSIAWNGATPADIAADADLYKPRFHEVTLP